MKRDIDLCRQLLLDIENHGTDCSLTVLRSSMTQDVDERIRYHLRLLIDAGFVKEIDRTSSGVPCVRLTSAGHEFIELVRGDARWREAKWVVQEQTGGVSLTVLRAFLTKWAVENIARTERPRQYRRAYRPLYHRAESYRTEPHVTEPYLVDSYRFEREPVASENEELRLLRTRPDYREGFDFYDRFEERAGYTPYDRSYAVYDRGREYADATVGVTLPVSLL